MNVSTHKGLTLLEIDPAGPVMNTPAALADLVGEAFAANADMVAVPVTRLGDNFFVLRTGLAGELFQKMETYQRRLAVVGDIGRHVAASKALRDFVYETNKRGHHLFAASRDEVLARL